MCISEFPSRGLAHRIEPQNGTEGIGGVEWSGSTSKEAKRNDSLSRPPKTNNAHHACACALPSSERASSLGEKIATRAHVREGEGVLESGNISLG